MYSYAEAFKIASCTLNVPTMYVVRTPVSANPALNFNPAFFLFLSKALSWIIFSILFRVSNHQIVGKENLTEFAF